VSLREPLPVPQTERSEEGRHEKGLFGPLFYPEDERFLVERENRVSHFDIVFRAGPLAGPER